MKYYLPSPYSNLNITKVTRSKVIYLYSVKWRVYHENVSMFLPCFNEFIDNMAGLYIFSQFDLTKNPTP